MAILTTTNQGLNFIGGTTFIQTGTTTVMSIKTDGKVGIGMTNPADKLDLFDANDNVGIYFHTATSGIGGGDGLRVGQNNANAFVWNYEATPLSLATGGTARLTINATGGIRFNTGYGAGTLVSDASGNITVSSGGGAGGPYLPLAGGTMTGTNGVVLPDNFILNVGTGNDLRIKHNATNSFIENHTGDLSIVNYANDKELVLWNDDGTGGIAKYLVLDGNTTHAYFTNPGNVGIGTTSPGSKLVVAGGTDTAYNDGTLKVVGSIALNAANNLNPALNRWALRPRAAGVEGSFDIYDARNSLSRLTIVNSGEHY